jgi:drug/metabolite transporter (DMT)-like permease
VLAVLFGALSGALFGAMAVAVRFGLRRAGADAHAGAVVVSSAATLVSGLAALVEWGGVRPGQLWPFVVAGVLVPGNSQLLFILAIRDAGPSRAAILIGTAPLMSVLIALALLGEPFHVVLVLGTVLIVAGGAALARERKRPEHFRALGAALALACAALFAVRDNLVRWGARGEHPPALLASTASLLAAALTVSLYFAVLGRGLRRPRLRRALPAFAPAGIALGAAYDCLFEAFDRGRVSVVAPLNATQSLWAVVFAALAVGATEAIGRRLVLAAVLIVAGGTLVSVFR